VETYAGYVDVTPQSQKTREREWLSTGDAAKELAVSGKTVLRWIQRGLIPARRIRSGGQFRIERTAIERFKATEQQEVRPATQEDRTLSRPD
jgi:excisionase family DNA binding protein